MKLAAIVFAIAGLGTVLLAREDREVEAPTVEAPTALPDFEVTADFIPPPSESWRYATVPGFEILSNASDKATQKLLRDFDMFRQALGRVWPIPDRLPETTSLILCAKGKHFEKFLPAGRFEPDAAIASVFLKQGPQTAIVIDLQATTFNIIDFDGLLDPRWGIDSGEIAVEHDKQLYREYARLLLSRSEPRLPAWLEEGLLQIIVRMQFTKRWIEFAKVDDHNSVSPVASMNAQLNAEGEDAGGDGMPLSTAPVDDRDFNIALRRKSLVPLDKFFAVDHDSPEATNVLGNNRWAKQAYAFVHMCLYGLNGKYQKPFVAFLQRLNREPVNEEMFQEVFGKTYRQMALELRLYISNTEYQHKLYRSKEDILIEPKPLELRDATGAEVGRIKGEALLLAGDAAGARVELFAPHARGERDPYLLAAIGLYEMKHGDKARARKLLQTAFEKKAKRPEACIELARLRLADAAAKPEADGGLSAQQTREVLAPLVLAQDTPPILPDLYDVAGDTWARSTLAPARDDAKLMIAGAIWFPTRLRIVYQAGVMARDVGEVRAAHALVEHGLHYAPNGKGKERFEALKATLPPAPPPETAGTAAAAPAQP